MTEGQRYKLQQVLSSLIGLELWLIGESEQPPTAEDDFCRLSARLGIYQAILWPHEDEHGEAIEDDVAGTA